MAAFTLTNARAMLTAPVAASVGGRAAKAAVSAAKAAPAFARVSAPARHFNGLAASGVSSAFRAPVAARAFHLTAFAADEEGAEAPARPDGGSSSSAANAIVEAEASTAGSSSLGAVAVSTARRAVRHRRDLGTADVIRDEPATRRPRFTVTRGAREGAPAAALDVATANILGRRGARCGRRAEGVRVAPLRMTCKSVETPRNAHCHENENPRHALREAV